MSGVVWTAAVFRSGSNFFSLATSGVGQTLKVQNPGTGTIPLDKDWRFHLGDEKAWADPALDDSNWEPIRVDDPGDSRAIRATQASPGTGSVCR